MDEERERLLEARVSALESQVSFLLRVNGIDLSGLRKVTNQILLKHYQNAVHLLGLTNKQYPLEVVEKWAELFCQLSEYEFARLQTIVEYEHTWEPFYQLCVRMMTVVRQQSGFSSNIALQQLYGLLNRSLKNLRDIGVLMLKKYPESLPNKAVVLLNAENPLYAL